MYELEIWNKYDYPSHWEWAGSFGYEWEAVKYAEINYNKNNHSWRVIVVHSES